MKESLKFLVMSLAIMPLFFTSCSEEDEGTKPVITLQEITTSGSNYVATVKITCDETAELSQVSVVYYYNNGNGSAYVSTDNIDFTGTNYNATAKITMPKTVDGYAVTNFTVAATTTDGGSDENTFAIEGNVTNPEPDYETFTVTMGGLGTTTAGSYLSVKDKKAYKQAELSSGNNVEIVFTGTDFISADQATAAIVKNNGHWAVIESTGDGQYSFTTSTGYEGYINIIEGSATSSSAVIEVKVIWAEAQE